MCGRYANHVERMREWVDIVKDWPSGSITGYNVAPSMQVPVLTQHSTQVMRWGLIPSWSKQGSNKFATFNARLESIDAKPAFSSAWNQRQTCLLPALGYYEWRVEDGRKQPYFVRSKSGQPLVFAGLYEPEHDDIPASCTILTKQADPAMAKLHPRIPLMASLENARDWLAGDVAISQHMLRPDLQVYAVDTKVNNVRSSGEELIQPLKQKI